MFTCFKQFHPDPSKLYLARENRFRVGVSALYLPHDHPIIGEFEAYLAAHYPLPRWLGLRRDRLRPLYYRLIGKEVTPAAVGITIFGNRYISSCTHVRHLQRCGTAGEFLVLGRQGSDLHL